MEEVIEIEVGRVLPSPYQPRLRFEDDKLEELAASIRKHGVIQPVLVRPAGGKYQLIAGERRLRAAQRLGLATIPALIRDYSDEQAVETALIENLQRENLTVVETARAYERLIAEHGYTQGQVAERTGKSRSAVSNTLRLLQLPGEVLEMLETGDLSEGHARVLLALPYPSLRIEVGEWAARNAVPVRDLERKVRELCAGGAAAAGDAARTAPARSDVHVAALEEQLRRHFGTKVGVTYRKGKGTLTLEFYSDDDLYRLLEAMGVEGL
ncbi:MAG: ParB/RepB/Spo0J family partition protein [Armatimonadota bacterium]